MPQNFGTVDYEALNRVRQQVGDVAQNYFNTQKNVLDLQKESMDRANAANIMSQFNAAANTTIPNISKNPNAYMDLINHAMRAQSGLMALGGQYSGQGAQIINQTLGHAATFFRPRAEIFGWFA